MNRTTTVVWSLVAAVVAILTVLGAVYGPRLVSEGRALVGPIVDIAKAEDRLAELNAELGFAPPEDGRITPDRFEVFLDVRRDLLPHYLEWRDMERQLERSGQEDWATAKEVLDAVRQITSTQIETLRNRAMSPAEFIWIEDLVYGDWVPKVEEAAASSATRSAVRAATRDTLEVLTAAERVHGTNAVANAVRTHLEGRLDELGSTDAPVVPGFDEETTQLLWRHRDEITRLDFSGYSGMHGILRGSKEVEVKINPSDSE